MEPMVVAVVFALLSLGHKVREGHRSARDWNYILSIIYEVLAVAFVVITLTMTYYYG